MRRMLTAPAAELLQLQPVRRRLAVLGCRIVPLFAITALHRNDLSGHRSLLNLHFTCGAGAPARDKSDLHVTCISCHVLFSRGISRTRAPATGHQPQSQTATARRLSKMHLASTAHPGLPTSAYCTISEIVPAPTVCPPSRIANRRPFSIATGVISSITSCTLSPGITISVPLGSSATPVTSVVRK
jgi:hypothetical protein